MRTVKFKELAPEPFGQYGTFARMIDPSGPKLGEEPVEFFRDMVPLDLGGKAVASFSVCRVLERDFVIDVTEYHSHTSEGILPLDSDALIHVAPATPTDAPPSDLIEVFRVPKGTFVALRPGVWHHAPFALGSPVANVLIVLPERTYANDCIVRELAGDMKVKVEV